MSLIYPTGLYALQFYLLNGESHRILNEQFHDVTTEKVVFHAVSEPGSWKDRQNAEARALPHYCGLQTFYQGFIECNNYLNSTT